MKVCPIFVNWLANLDWIYAKPAMSSFPPFEEVAWKVVNSSLEEMLVKLCKDKEMHEMFNTAVSDLFKIENNPICFSVQIAFI